jgi:Leucine-rich repeat (LRR) protein
VKSLELSYVGLSDRATYCVDFRGFSSLEELDLSGKKFSSLPFEIGFLPKLRVLFVHECKYLVSIPDVPSSLICLAALDCKSLEKVRIPKQLKKELFIKLDESRSLEKIDEDDKGLRNSFWHIRVRDRNRSTNKFQNVGVLFLSVSLAQKVNTHNWHIY